MSFQQGLSGLNATAKALDTIGNNVSNSGTIGFKSATAQFADVFAASLGSGGAGQIGIGSGLARVAQQFTQGNITNTNNPLDMAINGSGFYRMTTTAGTVTYSRAGQFQLDKSGYIINSAGLKLTGYAADAATGTISPGSLVPVQVVNTNIAPKVTSASSMQLNVDSRALPPSAMSSGSLTGGAALGATTSITQGSNDVLDLIVDGNNISVTIPENTTGYAPSELVSKLQSLINSALTGKGASVTVSNSTGGRLTITSDSKGSLGSLGQGSSVALNGLGGTAANDLLGAPEATVGIVGTGAYLTAGADLPTSVTIGSGESFTFTTKVGAVTTTKTVSLTAGTYLTTDGPPSAFAAQLQADVDAQFAPAGTLTVTASTQTQAKLKIAITVAGAGDTVTLGAMTSGVESLFGPTTVAGKDNFNSISGQTSGTLTSGSALVAPTIIAAPAVGANDTLDINIDGNAVSVTLAPKAAPGYDGSGLGSMLADLAADVQAKINAKLVTAGSTARVTVTVNSSNKLVVSSNSAGTSSSVTLTGTGGNAAATLFGASPVVLAGSQTQTVNPLGFTASTAQTVYDSQGNPHNLSLYFVKASQGNVWQMYSTLDNAQQQGPTELTFSGSGALLTPMPITLPAQASSYTFTSSSTNATQPDALQFTLDLAGTTQYGVSFGVNTLSQDGYSSGQLSGISVGANGIIQGRFSNGQSKNMGQIVLVSFNNPNGLQSLGGNQWAETTESGQPIPGGPGTGSLGLIQAAAVEESNVDLTKELVDMITQQRVYQANAQTIKTQDQVLQTLVNLR